MKIVSNGFFLFKIYISNHHSFFKLSELSLKFFILKTVAIFFQHKKWSHNNSNQSSTKMYSESVKWIIKFTYKHNMFQSGICQSCQNSDHHSTIHRVGKDVPKNKQKNLTKCFPIHRQEKILKTFNCYL